VNKKDQKYIKTIIYIMQSIKKYFPGLSFQQLEQLESLWPLYSEWNKQINLISRKDLSHFYERHVLHSLALLKVIQFQPGTRVMDFGTGGGFPGIPLAIACQDTEFVLIDSIGKKIKVVRDVADRLGLDNVRASQARGEEVKEKFDFVVSRAVKPLPVFLPWVRSKIKTDGFNRLANGVLYLKGGDFAEELVSLKENYRIFELSSYFEESYFETKKIIYLY
jgi:16S rRNA (guanine527-N7)-methyltransferase